MRFTVAIVAVVLAAACAGPTTTIDQVWLAPTARAEPPLQRVVTVMISDNITLRHSAEDELARQLASSGVQATPGYAVFHDGASNMRDVEQLKAQLRDLGFDGVVTMRIVDREQRTEAYPTFDAYWGYWGPYYGGYYWPYAYTETIYRMESAAYSLRTGELLWSALTRSVDPSSSRELVDTTSSVVAQELTRRGLAG